MDFTLMSVLMIMNGPQNLEEKHALRVQLEQKVDNLWMQFRDALQNYNMTTEERKTAFEALKVKDERSAKEIESQMRKLQRISVSWFVIGRNRNKFRCKTVQFTIHFTVALSHRWTSLYIWCFNLLHILDYNKFYQLTL